MFMFHRSQKVLGSGGQQYFNEKRPVNLRVEWRVDGDGLRVDGWHSCDDVERRWAVVQIGMPASHRQMNYFRVRNQLGDSSYQ